MSHPYSESGEFKNAFSTVQERTTSLASGLCSLFLEFIEEPSATDEEKRERIKNSLAWLVRLNGFLYAPGLTFPTISSAKAQLAAAIYPDLPEAPRLEDPIETDLVELPEKIQQFLKDRIKVPPAYLHAEFEMDSSW